MWPTILPVVAAQHSHRLSTVDNGIVVIILLHEAASCSKIRGRGVPEDGEFAFEIWTSMCSFSDPFWEGSTSSGAKKVCGIYTIEFVDKKKRKVTLSIKLLKSLAVETA